MTDHLHILLKAAARTKGLPPTPPLGLEARVLASWRDQFRSPGADWMVAFRPAFLLAGLIAIVSVCLNLGAIAHLRTQNLQRETEWNMAESALRLAVDL